MASETMHMQQAPAGAPVQIGPPLLPAELVIVIPTLNEKHNVVILVDRLTAALSGIRWEAVFVDDDSDDGTADVVRSIGMQIGRRRVQDQDVQAVLGDNPVNSDVSGTPLQQSGNTTTPAGAPAPVSGPAPGTTPAGASSPAAAALPETMQAGAPPLAPPPTGSAPPPTPPY